MLKPVSLLALDDESALLAEAAQRRVAEAHGLDDLVQWRRADSIADAIQSIRAQRQRPDSPLRLRDDISTRELVLVVVSATGPARATLLDTIAQIRRLYEQKRYATFFELDILCLLPEVVKSDDYAAAYGLLKALSAADPKPFGEVWLLDGTNGSRVQFGSLAESLDTYASAVAGALTFEAELSGALPGTHPRGMPPAFSSFGYAELFFPRDVMLQRVESRFAAELIQRVILRPAEAEGPASIKAKSFTTGIALPAQQMFRRFQPKALVSDRTRSADELITAVRNELQVYRDTIHLQTLDTLAKQSDHAAAQTIAQLEHVIDETVDGEDLQSAIHFLDALLDPLPDIRPGADPAPRNLVTDINSATAALDARAGFVANNAASDAARKRVRELANLVQDQRLVADTLAASSAAEQLEDMEREQRTLIERLPDLVFAEENDNNLARNAARDHEAARLAGETEAREQELRELFAQKPRAEHALREALEFRRSWLWRQVLWASVIVALIYAVPYAFGVLGPNLRRVTWTAAICVAFFALFASIRYVNDIAPRVRNAREALARIRAQIDATDKAKNAAYNDELQFEYDVAWRRATLNVLRRVREDAKASLEALRERVVELEALAESFTPPPIRWSGLSIAILDDDDVDRWYDGTAEERKPVVRELPIRRSETRCMPIDELRARVVAHAATAFGDLRKLTLGSAAATLANEAKLAQRLKRFAEVSAPLIEVRDDDVQAQQAMQRDLTLWLDPNDARWSAQLQRRFPEAQLKAAPDALRAHLLSRVLHFPAYVLGQVDYYRSRYEGSTEFADVPDLVPTDLLLTGPVRTAYEQILLGRAVGVIDVGPDGTLRSNETPLGTSHLDAAEHLASSGAAALRDRLRELLEPRLTIARDVEQSLRQLTPLTSLDRGILDGLVKRYAFA